MDIVKEWNEADHPRSEDGRFSAGAGGGSKARIGDTLPGGGKVAPGDIPWEDMHPDDQLKVRALYARVYGGHVDNVEGQKAFDALTPDEKLQYVQGEGAEAFANSGRGPGWKAPEAAVHPVADAHDWLDVPMEHQVAAREAFGRAWAHDNKDIAALQNVETEQRERMGRVAFDKKNDLKKLDWAKGMDADQFPGVADPLATPKPAGDNAFKPGEMADAKTGWGAVDPEKQGMVRENWAKEYAANQRAAFHDKPARPTDELMAEGRDYFDNRLGDEGKLNHLNRMDTDEFVKPAGAGEKMVQAHEALPGYKEWDRLPDKWQAVAQNKFEREWPEWAKKHGGDEFKDAPDENLQMIARSKWDALEDNSKLRYAQDQVPYTDYPELARRDFNVSDPRFWGDQPGGVGKPKLNIADVKDWGAVPENWKEAVQEHFANDFANKYADDPKYKDMDIEGRLAEGRNAFEDMPEEGKLWHAQNEVPASKFPEKEEPAPASEPTPTPTPEPTEESEETFKPESWNQMGGDQQNEAKEKWKDANRSDFIRNEHEWWADEADNFREVPKEVEEDTDWGHEQLKDITKDNMYGGGEITGEGPAFDAEQEQRVKEWQQNFDVEKSIENGAFTWDDDGNLTANTDLMVFNNNPHEGPGAEDQMMIPGVEREELANAFKKSAWAEVSEDYEARFKQAFGKEVEKRVDHMKENPPSYLAENIDERMDEQWDAMGDKSKFREAEARLSDLKGGENHWRNNDDDDEQSEYRGDVHGELESDPEFDRPEQKKMQEAAKDIASVKELGGGISETKMVKLKDGSKWVWKPSTGEAADVRSGIPAGEQYGREVAAGDIASLVGMKNLMPTSAVMKYDGEWGVMQQMIPNASNDGREGDAEFENTARRGTFFDFVIGNTDRHGKNWMSDENGKLWLIDHGLSFSHSRGDSHRYGMWSSVMGTNSDEKTVEIPESIKKPWRGKWDKIEEAMKRRGIDAKAIQFTKNRYDIAMGDGLTWGDMMEVSYDGKERP